MMIRTRETRGADVVIVRWAQEADALYKQSEQLDKEADALHAEDDKLFMYEDRESE